MMHMMKKQARDINRAMLPLPKEGPKRSLPCIERAVSAGRARWIRIVELSMKESGSSLTCADGQLARV